MLICRNECIFHDDDHMGAFLPKMPLHYADAAAPLRRTAWDGI